jgi:hypothetical protein
MSESLAGLDMPVLVPTAVPISELRVVATGKASVGGSDLEYWEDVSVAPGGVAPPTWTVRTLARRGCRPVGNGGWTLDTGVDATAGTAVTSLLLEQIPYGLRREETHRRADEAGDSARAIAGRLRDPRTWARTTMDVDGHAFMLWVHERAEGFAAVADLGACLVAAHGRSRPATWTFTLLAPAEAQVALGVGPD